MGEKSIKAKVEQITQRTYEVPLFDNFDLSYNLMFSTYAVTLINGEIRRFIRDNTPFRVSRSIKELSYDILAFKEDYTKHNGIEPTNSIIALNLDISEYMVSHALESLTPTISIYDPIYQDSGEPIYLIDQLFDFPINNCTIRHRFLPHRNACVKFFGKRPQKDVLALAVKINRTIFHMLKMLFRVDHFSVYHRKHDPVHDQWLKQLGDIKIQRFPPLVSRVQKSHPDVQRGFLDFSRQQII